MSSIEQASTKDGSASALDLRDVKVHFPLRAGGKTSFVKAVDGISLSVKADEIFGIAGESGCGKSTLARVLIGLVQPTSGEMLFQGQVVPRQAARGLMWLILGRDCAGADENWVNPVYDSAFKRASDDERAMALVYLEDWLKGRHD